MHGTARDVTKPASYPSAGVIDNDGALVEIDGEEAALVAEIRAHQSVIEKACQRAPWLGATKPHFLTLN